MEKYTDYAFMVSLAWQCSSELGYRVLTCQTWGGFLELGKKKDEALYFCFKF